MLRNIHFFNTKAGADERRMLHLMDDALADEAIAAGCIERKTWKLLDAHSQGEAAQSEEYMNESLWPSQKVADAWSQTGERSEHFRKASDELREGIEIIRTVRYVDEEGWSPRHGEAGFRC